jgi:hypothetical protein
MAGTSKVLTLPLKRKWFDMIKSGEKLEEYREAKPFYIDRFIKFEPLKNDMKRDYDTGFDEGEVAGANDELVVTSKRFDKLVFTLGYPGKDDKRRRMVFSDPMIRMGEGNPSWGAEPGKLYFIITWGHREL